jgi:hypothetical protein
MAVIKGHDKENQERSEQRNQLCNRQCWPWLTDGWPAPWPDILVSSSLPWR